MGVDQIEGGCFLMARNLYDNELWAYPIQLRIFLYICGKAVFRKEGYDIGGVHIPRGSFLASYRKLSDGTAWIDRNEAKEYNISTIKKATDKLIEKGRLTKTETGIGTLWTVTNYEKYQTFSSYDSTKKQGLATDENSNTANEINTVNDSTSRVVNGGCATMATRRTKVLTNDSLFRKADSFLKTKGITFSSLILEKRMQTWEKIYEEAALNEAFSTAAEAWITQGKTGNFLQYLNKILQNDYPKKSENQHEAA